jgi:hypothetical protein
MGLTSNDSECRNRGRKAELVRVVFSVSRGTSLKPQTPVESPSFEGQPRLRGDVIALLHIHAKHMTPPCATEIPGHLTLHHLNTTSYHLRSSELRTSACHRSICQLTQKQAMDEDTREAHPSAARPMADAKAAQPDDHERGVEEREAFEAWGYMFKPDKTGTDKLKALLRGLKNVIVCLSPEKRLSNHLGLTVSRTNTTSHLTIRT